MNISQLLTETLQLGAQRKKEQDTDYCIRYNNHASRESITAEQRKSCEGEGIQILS